MVSPERVAYLLLLDRMLDPGQLFRGDDAVEAGDGLDWTIVRPPRLTNGAATGRYRIAIDGRVRGGLSISRADLAAAVLSLIDNPAALRAAVDIAY